MAKHTSLLVLALPFSFAALVFACGTESDPIPDADDAGGQTARSQEPDASDDDRTPGVDAGELDADVNDAGEDADAGFVCPAPEQRSDDCRHAKTDPSCPNGKALRVDCVSPDGGPMAAPRTFQNKRPTDVCVSGPGSTVEKPVACCEAICIRVRALDCPNCGPDKEFYECVGVPFEQFPSYCTRPPELNPPDPNRRTTNLCCEKQ